MGITRYRQGWVNAINITPDHEEQNVGHIFKKRIEVMAPNLICISK